MHRAAPEAPFGCLFMVRVVGVTVVVAVAAAKGSNNSCVLECGRFLSGDEGDGQAHGVRWAAIGLL